MTELNATDIRSSYLSDKNKFKCHFRVREKGAAIEIFTTISKNPQIFGKDMRALIYL